MTTPSETMSVPRRPDPPSPPRARPLPKLDKPKPDCLRADMPILSRSVWRARPPRSVEPLEIPEVPHVILTDTKGKTCADQESCCKLIRAMQRKHMDRKGEPDIKYNFLVGGDGQVYEGRGWHHCPAENRLWPEVTKKCLLIAYIGLFKKPDQPPVEMVKPAWELLEVGFVKDYIALDFSIHQKKHLPMVYNFVNDQKVLGIDYF